MPSGVTSAWCEIEMFRGLLRSAGNSEMFGITEIVRTFPESTFETSTMNDELMAATYIVLPSREKWMSWGSQSPLALEPPGLVMTTQVKSASAGQRPAEARRDSSISR